MHKPKTTASATNSASAQAPPSPPVPPIFYLLLYRPDQLQKNLVLLKERGHISQIPTLWQVFQGMAQQWRHTASNFDKLGHDPAQPVRGTLGARLLKPQLMRFVPLLLEGAINPWDRTGLALTPQRKMRHILGTHHPGDTMMYDLQLLDCYPGTLQELRRQLAGVLAGDTPRSQWLKDLVVYEGYHEELLGVVDRALAGDFEPRTPVDESDDSTVGSFVNRCLACPATPQDSVRQWLGVG